jgi:hypothetical protein
VGAPHQTSNGHHIIIVQGLVTSLVLTPFTEHRSLQLTFTTYFSNVYFNNVLSVHQFFHSSFPTVSFVPPMYAACSVSIRASEPFLERVPKSLITFGEILPCAYGNMEQKGWVLEFCIIVIN